MNFTFRRGAATLANALAERCLRRDTGCKPRQERGRAGGGASLASGVETAEEVADMLTSGAK